MLMGQYFLIKIIFYIKSNIIFFYSLNTINEGKVAIGVLTGFLPCTPNGCMELIRKSGVQIVGANAVVIGRLNFFVVIFE